VQYLDTLPTLGIGISTSLSVPVPDFTRLLRERPELVEFVEFAVDHREAEPLAARLESELAAGTHFIAHPIELSLDPSDEPSPRSLRALRRIVETLRAPWTPQDIGTWVWNGEHLGGGFIPCALTRETLDIACDRVRTIQNATGVPFLVENPPYADVAGDLTLGAFFRELCERAETGMLLDIGHLLSYQLARPNDHALLNELPLESVVETHLAGGAWIETTDGPVFWDNHALEIAPEARALLAALWPRLPRVRALCFECELRNEDSVVRELSGLHASYQFPGRPTRVPAEPPASESASA
jgi:uncharacterized protein (UPF0276 family)